jgi:hypothetical protein
MQETRSISSEAIDRSVAHARPFFATEINTPLALVLPRTRVAVHVAGSSTGESAMAGPIGFRQMKILDLLHQHPAGEAAESVVRQVGGSRPSSWARSLGWLTTAGSIANK